MKQAVARAIAADFIRPEYRILAAIWQAPTQFNSAGQIAGVPITTARAMILRMAAEGLIDQTPDTRDGRMRWLTLTDAGRKKVEPVLMLFAEEQA
ncbi:MAG: hypothetical protein WDA25_01115 [Paracoccaceae bacterium]